MYMKIFLEFRCWCLILQFHSTFIFNFLIISISTIFVFLPTPRLSFSNILCLKKKEKKLKSERKEVNFLKKKKKEKFLHSILILPYSVSSNINFFIAFCTRFAREERRKKKRDFKKKKNFNSFIRLTFE